MEFFLFISRTGNLSQDWKIVSGIGKLYHGFGKTVRNLQYPGRPGVKIQSDEF